MHLGDLRQWLVARDYQRARVERAEPATLPGHRLVFNCFSPSRGCGAANVEPASEHDLPGMALRVDDVALVAIDRKEGHPQRYRRGPDLLEVTLASGRRVAAWLYVVRPEFREAGHVPPKRSYVDLLIDVAEQQGFPEWYLRQLRAIEVVGEGG